MSELCVMTRSLSCIQSQGGSNDVEFHGRLVITEGATFTEELRNKSSLGFKALAFDMQLLVRQLSHFIPEIRGSVVVHFHLVFRDAVKAAIAQEQLVSSIQTGDAAGLSIDRLSIKIFPSSPLHLCVCAITVGCPEGKKACSDGTTCVPVTHFCDGIPNCPDGLDESERHCATVCDGQFLLLGPSGYFHSKNFPLDYDNNTACRWIIRYDSVSLSHRLQTHLLSTANYVDILVLYEGIGPGKKREYLLSGSSPGTIWLLSSEVTVEFSSNLIINEQGFSATYWAEDITHLSNEEKINCTFEEGFCFWRQDHEDDDDWIRAKGFTFPALTGPLYDHTLGNESGYYIITQSSQGYWRKAYRIQSLPLASENGSVCLRFWYHMYGMDVWRLIIMTKHESAISTLFLKEGNYGDNWNYGQITINHTVVFEAQKNGGLRNNIALDDISMTSGPCGEGVPGPTTDPHITIPPPTPSDCGGPFDLYLSNSTFSSPNYPNNYGNQYSCLWILHAEDGQNIQLHFQDFGTETSYDVVEVRDGEEPHSRLLAVLTGNRVFPDLFSTTSRLTVRFTTDLTGKDRGFLANFSTGIHLGQPEACETGQYQCRSGECVPSSSVCDGTVSCPDGSDESYCVHLMSVNATGAQRLRIQVEKILYTVCAEVWSHQLPNFFCRYLGFRSGNISFVPLSEEDSPFATVTLTTEGTLELKPRYSSIYKGESSTLKEASSEKQETSYYGMGRVVGGEDAQKGAWPWMVSLKWQGRHVCGAALIDREWLVTAAHCVYGKNIHLSYWEAVLGVHTQNNDETSERQTHLVDQVIMNQLYNRETKDADIALMHLKTQVNFTGRLSTCCQQFEPGRKCVIAGWGYLTEGGSVANILQQAVLPILSRAQCQEWLPEYDITERMVCAGYAEGGIDSCKGDSGGPLMCEEDNHWVLVGVTAFGKGCGQPQRPGAYARVSQFTDWVLETRRLSSVWHGDG
uniref:Transmembrane serine protease 15 n=1 Tax=Electrophorus electricus TaxID=8005 RepID=A0A4W4EDD0_ELEEL